MADQQANLQGRPNVLDPNDQAKLDRLRDCSKFDDALCLAAEITNSASLEVNEGQAMMQVKKHPILNLTDTSDSSR